MNPLTRRTSINTTAWAAVAASSFNAPFIRSARAGEPGANDKIRLALDRIGAFLNRLARTAEQLSVEAVWAIILSSAFVKWLRGKVLQPVSQGGQLLFRLTSMKIQLLSLGLPTVCVLK